MQEQTAIKARLENNPGKIQYGGIGKQLCIIIQGMGLGKEGGYIGALLSRTEASSDFTHMMGNTQINARIRQK